MVERTEPLRQDIDAIRDSMTDKLEQIESKVKGSVDSTVEQVKRTFDIQQQVSDHPWAALGLAFAAGYLIGAIGGDEPYAESQRDDKLRNYAVEPTSDAIEHGVGRPAAPERPRQKSNPLGGIMNQFSGELNMITSAAIAAGVGMLRDTVKESIPQFSQEYERARQQNRDTESQPSELRSLHANGTLP